MAGPLLPYVSAQTAKSLRLEISNDGASVLKETLRQLVEENPVLAANMQVWAMTQPDPEAAMVGPGMMYALLRRQAANNSETRH